MPLSSGFMDELLSSWGVDPSTPDPLAALSAFDLSSYNDRGLRDDLLNDSYFQDPTPGFWGGLENIGTSVLGSVAKTGLGLGEAGLDLFSSVFDSTAPESEESSNLLSQWRSASDYLGSLGDEISVAQGTLHRPTDSGGGILDEVTVDLSAGRIGETATDVGEFLVEQGLDMAAHAGVGKVLGLAAGAGGIMNSGRSLMAGYAADTFQDNYNELTADPTDSRLTALIASASSAGVQGYLEKLGFEEMLGKGAVSALVKSKLSGSRAANALAGGLVNIVTEGGTEAAQQAVDILARNAHTLEDGDWGEWAQSVLTQEAGSEMANAFFGGALFGGIVGGTTWGAEKTAAKQIAAGSNTENPDLALLNGLQKPPLDSAKELLVDRAEAGDVDAVEMLSQAINTAEVDAQISLQDMVEEANNQTIEQESAIPDAGKEDLQAIVGQSIQNAGLGQAYKVLALQNAANSLLGSLQGGSIMGEDGMATEGMNATPQEIQLLLTQEAMSMGLDVANRDLSNPAAIDWNEWAQQEGERASDEAAAALAPLQEQTVPVAEPAVQEQVKKKIGGWWQRAEREAAGEGYLDGMISDGVTTQQVQREFFDHTYPLLSKANKKKFDTYIKDLTGYKVGDVIGSNADGTPWVAQSAEELLDLSNDLEMLEAIERGFVVMMDYANKNAPRSGVKNVTPQPAGLLESPVQDNTPPQVRAWFPPQEPAPPMSYSGLLGRQQGKVSMSPDLRGVSLDKDTRRAIRVSDAYLSVSGLYRRPTDEDIAKLSEANRLHANSHEGESIGLMLLDPAARMRGALDEGRENSSYIGKEAQQEVGRATATNALTAASVRFALFKVWSEGSVEDIDVVGRTLVNPNKGTEDRFLDIVIPRMNLGNQEAPVRSLIQSDQVAREEIFNILRSTGRKVFSPVGMFAAMKDSGMSQEDAKISMSVMDAIASTWAKKTGNSKLEWWDRAGDWVVSRRGVGGSAQAYVATPLWGSKGARVGRGVLALFNDSGYAPTPRIIAHETIHILRASGLLFDMLTKSQLLELEEFAGELLFDRATGEPKKDVSAKADERLAVGFEKFMIEHEAPTPALRAAFQSVKEYFANIIREVLGAVGIHISSITTPHFYKILDAGKSDSGVEHGRHPYAYYGSKVQIKWKELGLSKNVAAAYYALLTTDPVEVKDPYVHGTKPGILSAIEEEASNSTGLDATGWLFSEGARESPVDGYKPAGWSPNSGQAPTVEEFASMHGLVNDTSNGSVTTVTLAEMDDKREKLGHWAEQIRESPVDPKSPTRKQLANQKAQDALASEAPIAHSTWYDPAMDEFADLLISGEKDLFNLGKKLDPSDAGANIAMLQTFSSKMLNWRGLWSQGKYSASVKEAGADILKGTASLLHSGWKAFERGSGNYAAPVEQLFRDLGLVQESMQLNNLHAVAKMAEKVVTNPPAIWDNHYKEWRPVKGAKSWVQIFANFEHMAKAYFKDMREILPYKTYREFHKSVFRDLKMYALAKAQIELDANVKKDLKIFEARKKEWQALVDSGTKKGQYAELNPPKAPRMPKVDPEITAMARNITRLVNARYGKHVGMFQLTTSELTYWSNLMKLEKLRAANMISDKAHADMTSKRTAYIPFYRIKNAVLDNIELNPKLDDSLYDVLHYLKQDLGMKVEDPFAALLRSAQSVEILTQRQAAKNSLGNHLLNNVRWWDPKDSGVEIMAVNHEITKAEYEALPADSSKKKEIIPKRNKKGFIVGQKERYLVKRPINNDEFKKFLNGARERAGLKGKDVSAKDIQAAIEHQVFAFYPEPGKAMYVRISNPDVARAFYHMNNPQALYFNSFMGKIQEMLGKPVDKEKDAITKTVHHTLKLLGNGFFNGNRMLKRFFVTSPKFIYNMLFRDIPQALVRSRHGLTLLDVVKALRESTLLMFPSIRELNPGNHLLSEDSAYGIGPYSGIVAMDKKGGLNVEGLSLLLKDRVQLMEDARNGSRMAKLNLAWGDFRQYLASEGLDKDLGTVFKDIRAGREVKSNLLYVGKSIFAIPKIASNAAGFFATMVENAPRLAERKLTMYEDMSQYPTLLKYYDPKKAIQGKIMAGFNGRTHRHEWNQHKRKLKANPDHVVPETAMPIQFSGTERDYSTAHITLPFHNRGSVTHNIEPFNLFYNASAQDTYTNLKIVGQHSLVQRALVAAGAKRPNNISPEAQARLDSQAYAWILKSFFYMTIPALAQYAIYSGDDDDSREWQAQSFIEKMSYWHIPLPNGKKFRLATGLGLSSLLFHDLPASVMLELSGKDPKGLRKWAERFFDSTPVGLAMNVPMALMTEGGKSAARELAFQTVAGPETAKPLAEFISNWDEFRNSPIGLNEALYRGDPTEINRDKYNYTVNSAAKTLNIQPREAAFLIRRYFPGWTVMWPSMVNAVAEGVASVPEDITSSNRPVAGQSSNALMPQFTPRDPWGMGNEFVQDLMRTYNEVARQRVTYESKNETQRAQYLAENPMVNDKTWSTLKQAYQKVVGQEKQRKALLAEGRELDAQAMERIYTLHAMEVMRGVLTQTLGGN